MAEKNLIAMRLGPGKHLKDRTLMDGVVSPEEVSSPSSLSLTLNTHVQNQVRLLL
jgi:hypothetical protein